MLLLLLLMPQKQHQQQEELSVLSQCWPARSSSSSGGVRLMVQTALTVSCQQEYLGW